MPTNSKKSTGNQSTKVVPIRRSKPTPTEQKPAAEVEQPAVEVEQAAAQVQAVDDELALNDDRPMSAEEYAHREAQRRLSKTKLIKLNREAIWHRLTKKHGMPLAKPGANNDGVKLATSTDGPGFALVTYRADSIADEVERLQFIEQQVEACAAILLDEGFPVERINPDGVPHLKIPVVRQPNAADQPKKARRAAGTQVEQTFIGGEGI